MRTLARMILGLVLITQSLAFGHSLVVQQTSSDSSEIFKPILSQLQKTRVPLRLPTYLATENETNQLYAIVEAATPSRYQLQLAFAPDCAGGTACRYGMVEGQTFRSKSKRLKGKAVKLDNNITGYFVDATCGANCTDSTLSWVQGAYRYTVGVKAADVKTLTKIANSAINSSAAQP